MLRVGTAGARPCLQVTSDPDPASIPHVMIVKWVATPM